MKYLKATYIKLLKCPDCHFYQLEENDGMPDRDDFKYAQDKDGVEYVECPCGCKFIE